MGCKGSKTAQAAKPVEQQPATATLLQEPSVDDKGVKPDQVTAEAPMEKAEGGEVDTPAMITEMVKAEDLAQTITETVTEEVAPANVAKFPWNCMCTACA